MFLSLLLLGNIRPVSSLQSYEFSLCFNGDIHFVAVLSIGINRSQAFSRMKCENVLKILSDKPQNIPRFRKHPIKVTALKSDAAETHIAFFNRGRADFIDFLIKSPTPPDEARFVNQVIC